MRQPKDINTLLALAAQGDNGARKQIGSMYYYGCGGVEQNYEEAVKWFKAANYHEKLGMCYLYGHAVEQNHEEAAKCFLAADNKDMLGECYLHGLGVERKVNKTIELWETACEEHFRNYDVMLKLAHLYGDGVEIGADQIIVAENEQTVAAEIHKEGGIAEGSGKLILDRITLTGDLVIAGVADESSACVVNTSNTAGHNGRCTG